MEHVAIMKKSWKLLPKILSGKKTIESRWYINKCPPWNNIKEGEIIYFKNSGEPVTLKAEIGKVLQFSDLNENKVREILNKHGKDDGLEKEDFPKYFDLFKNKNYCMLIYLKNVEKIQPFNINKKGFGMMSVWLSLGNVGEIKCT